MIFQVTNSIVIVKSSVCRLERIVCVKRSVWGGEGGGGGGAHRRVIHVPSVKNQYKRVVFGYMVIYCVSLLILSTR